MPDVFQRAKALIGDLTPMKSDCGALCGAACCQTDEDGQGGVWLLGGEEASQSGVPWAHVGRDADSGYAILLCDGPCDRGARPLCCRLFPLAPVMGRDGKWTVRLDARARPLCPLVKSGLGGLDRDFVRACRDAVRLLAEDPQGLRVLEDWAAQEAAFRAPLW